MSSTGLRDSGNVGEKPALAHPGAVREPQAGILTWAIITGEYPPQPGGVSDYTRLVAEALAASGDRVHVWAPECPGPSMEENGVHVHRLPGHFGLKALSILDSDLKQLPDSCRLLVQYVPHAYGLKAMNVPFCLWLAARRRHPVWVMYHEVAYPLSWSQPLKHNFLGVVTRGMASIVARAAERIYISTPTWESILPNRPSMTWLPVPSNIPTNADAECINRIRRRIAPQPGQVVIGHFGTFGSHVMPRLADLLPVLLAADPKRVALLAGPGGKRFVTEMIQTSPELEDRVVATNALEPGELAAHLSACDVLIQPYVDGASGRRGSLMAGLGLGLPIITTYGARTEPVWQASGAVVLAPALSTDAFLKAAEALLADLEWQADLRRKAIELYEERFALAKTIRELRS